MALGVFGIGLGFVYARDAAVGGVLIIALMGFTAVVGLFCLLGLTRRTGRKLNARAFTAPAAKTALFGDLLGLSITSTRSKTTWRDEVNLRPSTQIFVRDSFKIFEILIYIEIFPNFGISQNLLEIKRNR